jgi:hypothetical protein
MVTRRGVAHRDDPAGGEGAAVDRDPGEAVQLAEHDVLAAGHGDEDCDDQGPQPDGKALFRSVEACHPTSDVTPAVVGDEEDDEQDDATDEADARWILTGVARRLPGIRAGRDPDSRACGCHERGRPDGRAYGERRTIRTYPRTCRIDSALPIRPALRTATRVRSMRGSRLQVSSYGPCHRRVTRRLPHHRGQVPAPVESRSCRRRLPGWQ